MQMTTEARAWLDATVRRILARHPLGDAERMGVTYELMSHLHGAGEANATKDGRTEVTRQDLEAALAESNGEEGLAQAFVQPLAKPVQRVLLLRRAGALAIDLLLIGIGLSFVHGALELLLRTIGVPVTVAEDYHGGWFVFLPWGYHDAGLALHWQAVFTAFSAAVVLGYFTWFEGHEGRSLGKRVFDLRVVRVDGQPMTYREALVRNLVKLSPPLFLLDTMIMVIVFFKQKQRVSDRMAQTIVVRA
ncbi:MAG TPA: RDD family protein [Candidatus Thermoplasmatota archaeon]